MTTVRSSASPTATPLCAASSLRIVVAHNESQLREHLSAWDDLAAAALEPNVFYESWCLLPALRHFDDGLDLRIVLVYAANAQSEKPVLCGLFPLQRKSRFRALPVASLSLWKHLYAPLCTPLVRAEGAKESLRAFLDWLARDSESAPILEMPAVAADGPFHQLWADVCRERAIKNFNDELHTKSPAFLPLEIMLV